MTADIIIVTYWIIVTYSKIDIKNAKKKFNSFTSQNANTRGQSD